MTTSAPLRDRRESSIRFDKTINLGHVLTIGSFLALTLTQWNMMDKRITMLEEFREAQRERDTSQDTNIREKAQEVKEALVELKRVIEKLGDRMDSPV